MDHSRKQLWHNNCKYEKRQYLFRIVISLSILWITKLFIYEGALKQAISFCCYSNMHVQILSSTVPQQGYKEYNVVQLRTTASNKHCGGRVLFICTNFLMSCSVNLDRKVAKLVNALKC